MSSTGSNRASIRAVSFVAAGLASGCADPCIDDGVSQQKDNCPQLGGSQTDDASDTSASVGSDPSATTSPTTTDATDASADASDGPTTSATTADTGDTEGDPDLDHFGEGSIVIPMDTDYQDMGMLEAYGLVYALLQAEIPIAWTIAAGKEYGGVDFTAEATDLRTGDAVPEHGYRGGPFVVPEEHHDAALPIVEEWLAANPNTTVHSATTEFDAHVARRLLHAPTIAIFADGNEDIARDYLLAAKIPDSTGDLSWPNDSPDLLDVAEISGPSDVVHDDGALFNVNHVPRYCQLMSMHWGVTDAEANPEVVAEVRAYLQFSTHFFAECQAVNAFENLEPHGFFLTPNGFEITDQPSEFDFYRMDTPFGQIDGAFDAVGGSEPSYTLPDGDAYFESDTVIITAAGTPEGDQDVWMTGFIDGACPATEPVCDGAGKVSYLGGHQYGVDLPISQHATTQGARLFLNSLFEAPCVLFE